MSGEPHARPGRWHDPLHLLREHEPGKPLRAVLVAVSLLVLLLVAWATVGRLDVVISAEGRLAPQTLLKIVQPAESGVVRDILVEEGQSVSAGQVLARLDASLARADKSAAQAELAWQSLQMRRVEAELAGQLLRRESGDEAGAFAQALAQYESHRRAYLDTLQRERAGLERTRMELASAQQTMNKLLQTLPVYERSAEAFGKLERDGFIAGLAAAEKQREAIEKARELDAQKALAGAAQAAVDAQETRLAEVTSTYKSDLNRDLADLRLRISQLQPRLDKATYQEQLLELRAPQAGTVKDLATTTVGAVVQPGAILMTLVPHDEALFADVEIRNEDAAALAVGGHARLKLAAYPFQKYGLLAGTVVRMAADASEDKQRQAAPSYKARIALDTQYLLDPYGERHHLSSGMQVTAEINHGDRTLLEYLLSPVRKVVAEAARER